MVLACPHRASAQERAVIASCAGSILDKGYFTGSCGSCPRREAARECILGLPAGQFPLVPKSGHLAPVYPGIPAARCDPSRNYSPKGRHSSHPALFVDRSPGLPQACTGAGFLVRFPFLFTVFSLQVAKHGPMPGALRAVLSRHTACPFALWGVGPDISPLCGDRQAPVFCN